MDIVTQILHKTPTKLTSKLRGTFLEDLYATYNFRINHRTITLPSPIGNIDLVVDSLNRIIANKSHSKFGYEPGLIHLMKSELSDKTIYFDIGSRFGFYAIVAQNLGVDPKNIHLFESDSTVLEYLKYNVDKSCNLNSTHIGTATDNLSVNKYVENNSFPTVVKIDVEGAEEDVLKSMNQLLHKKPTLFIEYHPHKLKKDTDIFEILNDYGYEIKYIDHRVDSDEVCYLDSPHEDSTTLIYAVAL